MEFNKIISLVLGFIVVILLLVWVSNRLKGNNRLAPTAQVSVTRTPTPTPNKENKSWNPFSFLFKKTTPTPTKVTVKVIPTSVPVVGRNNVDYKTGQPIVTPTGTAGQRVVVTNTPVGTTGNTTYNNQGGNIADVRQIPNTGAPTLLLPLAFSALGAGFFLKKRS